MAWTSGIATPREHPVPRRVLLPCRERVAGERGRPLNRRCDAIAGKHFGGALDGLGVAVAGVVVP